MMLSRFALLLIIAIAFLASPVTVAAAPPGPWSPCFVTRNIPIIYSRPVINSLPRERLPPPPLLELLESWSAGVEELVQQAQQMAAQAKEQAQQMAAEAKEEATKLTAEAKAACAKTAPAGAVAEAINTPDCYACPGSKLKVVTDGVCTCEDGKLCVSWKSA